MKLINFLMSIVCFFLGHKSIPKYTEDERAVYDEACSRCSHTLGFPKLFLWIPRCPTSTKEEWDEFIQERKNEIKKNVEDEIKNRELSKT